MYVSCSTASLRTISTNNATSLSIYSTESHIKHHDFIAAYANSPVPQDIHALTDATQSPTSDSPSTPEVGGVGITDVVTILEKDEPYIPETPLLQDQSSSSSAELRYHLHIYSYRMTINSLLAMIHVYQRSERDLNVSNPGLRKQLKQ